MGNVNHQYTRHFDQVMRILCGRGLLLAAYDKTGRANAMTIGWGSVGIIWGMPVWTTLVRPSRYTYECIEASRSFAVCVPPVELTGVCTVCGSQSGRLTDKLGVLGVKTRRGKASGAPIIEGCPIVYECTVVHTSDVNPDLLDKDIDISAYSSGDYHRMYWGRIEAVHIAADAEQKLAK